MTNFEEVEVGQSKEMPAKMVLYGIPKIGKSKFASQIEDVFFLNIEDGLQYLPTKVRSTPKIEKYKEAIDWLTHIYNDEKFICGRIAIDSLDWLENLAKQRVEEINGAPLSDKNHKANAHGNGYVMLAEHMNKIFNGLDAIYKKKAIPSILIAHSQIREIDLPDKEPYSKYDLKVSKSTSAKTSEWADIILFADYSFHVTKDGKVSEPKPVLYAGGSAAFNGGGRMVLSKEIPLDYNELKKEITKISA